MIIQGILLKALVWLVIALAIIIVGAVIYEINRFAFLKFLRRNGKFCLGGFSLLAFVCTMHGGSKTPTAGVYFYRTDPEIAWLKDTGSYVSNDVVHVSFQPHAQLPDSAILQMWNCPTNSVEDHSAWAQYGADVTLADCPREFDIAYSNAMAYAWCFCTTYTRPTQVVTNGVLHINYVRAHKAEEENDNTVIGVPLHTDITVDGEKIEMFKKIDLLTPLSEEGNNR